MVLEEGLSVIIKLAFLGHLSHEITFDYDTLQKVACFEFN